MKIDQPAPSATPLPRPTATGAAGTAAAAAATAATAAARPKEAAQPSAHVHAMPSAVGGSDFDAARVAAIREDIRAGRYQIRPERIADGLLASVRDLLDAPVEGKTDPKGRE
ncbi:MULTISPECIES: flagellar biosynthesis anti-sigma factor FlgM [unclassified Variovorax]|uniref:flagellar biosynthesis anti-sigma factor FlgM n=1 Tax=unclassified Variovorax TaxID=663243 RepID=UPI003F45A9B1